MTPNQLRQLIIHTVCNVTGEEPEEILAHETVTLDTRDWEQVFSRLEATLDIDSGLLAGPRRSFEIDELTRDLHARLSGAAGT
ncbi:hypothetical protein CDN99_20605 [Roseateles aquatilis]|uniref:Carrier domain-containing protein n=1 Tax=Roseateles aquatilis TaxID=431061 RepID=A0A246J0V2_9BURK|nr:DUF6137 domain-containing protein [Roseateles aquatilis]OWQ86239.1 hypothetical protein CDN99_20605 [Roseateles aquatilis]